MVGPIRLCIRIGTRARHSLSKHSHSFINPLSLVLPDSCQHKVTRWDIEAFSSSEIRYL